MNEVEVFVIPALRIARPFLLLLGLVSLVGIMRGAFLIMTIGVRMDYRSMAIRDISLGIAGMVIVAGLFSVATVALQNVS